MKGSAIEKLTKAKIELYEMSEWESRKKSTLNALTPQNTTSHHVEEAC